jgi:hypothetical protein
VRTIAAHVTLPSATAGVWPVTSAALESHLSVYEAVGRAQPVTPVTLDLGDGDLEWWPSGFYPPESMQGASARWTMGHGSVRVGPIEFATGIDHAVLAIRFATGRDTPVDVQILIGGQPAGTITARSRGFADYMQVLTAGAIDALRTGTTIEIVAPTFVPSAASASTDRRALGVAIDWLRISNGR